MEKYCVISSAFVVDRLKANDDVTEHIVPASILTYFNLPSPKGALTAAYGVRGQRILMHTLGRSVSAELYCVNAEFAVPRNIGASMRIGHEDLPQVNTLNLLRLRSELLNEIIEIWNGFFKSKMVPQNERTFPRTGTARPDLIEKLSRLPRFSHIDLFIYPAITEGGWIAVASYFKPEEIDVIRSKPSIKGPLAFSSIP